MKSPRLFLKGFLTSLSIILLANIMASHFLSDCGLPAVLGIARCSDDIIYVGFPFIFHEKGGFDYRDIFNTPFFVLDVIIGLGVAGITGYILNKKSPPSQ